MLILKYEVVDFKDQIRYMFYMYKTSQFGLATLQVLSFSKLRGVRVSVHVRERERGREKK